ncbi:hypothetical protein [Paraburkholderia susongensis]|uniref:Tail tubular protein A n=1 Tax=Paraburkholderia susongensis TaxID=1515439 RepID=A0A1X7KPC6_9BURK|nr:hypothetical protein [Paraburkholderia susongensis]SMG43232.1 hypothetical protein SAMN06265784_104145 [Paraburkholderia susongensis]
MATAFMTELEAVNMCLAAIGESPVNTLQNSGLADVASARAKLTEFSRTVQSTGWAFNTEHGFPLTRAADGTITAPLNVLKVSIDRRVSAAQVAQRGQRIYDKKNHTYVFTEDLKADVVFFLDWDELPQTARQYIAVCAARSFQATAFTSDTIDKLTENDELKALVALKDAEGDNGEYNMFYDSYSVAEAWIRPDTALLYNGSSA